MTVSKSDNVDWQLVTLYITPYHAMIDMHDVYYVFSTQLSG